MQNAGLEVSCLLHCFISHLIQNNQTLVLLSLSDAHMLSQCKTYQVQRNRRANQKNAGKSNARPKLVRLLWNIKKKILHTDYLLGKGKSTSTMESSDRGHLIKGSKRASLTLERANITFRIFLAEMYNLNLIKFSDRSSSLRKSRGLKKTHQTDTEQLQNVEHSINHWPGVFEVTIIRGLGRGGTTTD